MSEIGPIMFRARGASEIVPIEIGIDRKLAFLGSREAYRDSPARIERIETHFSWVFLTERHVYKLKKPVHGEGFDLSSLDARRHNAEVELRLNRRLAADVYLGVVPLTWAPDRGLSIGGGGMAVDWLVEMARLPADHMLDRRIAGGNLRQGDIHGLAERLAAFFAGARRVPMSPRRYCERFRAECRSTRRAFRACASRAQQEEALRIARQVEAFIARRRPLRSQRAERVVEGHGDLRPEHICLGSAVRIIDCVEFRADLRLLDPVDELAFLALECERLGARDIERILFRHYCRRTGDAAPEAVVRFYKAVAALIRARIAILHLRDAGVPDPAKWTNRAAGYLAIARHHTGHLR